MPGALDGGRHVAELLRHRLERQHGGDPLLTETLEQLTKLVDELAVHQGRLDRHHDQLARLAGQLQLERRRFRTLFDEAPDPYLVTDRLGIVRQRNRRARLLLGLEPVGRPLMFAVARDEWAIFHQFLTRCTTDSGRHATDGSTAETTLTFDWCGPPLRMQVECRPLEDLLLWTLHDVTRAEAERAGLAEAARRERSAVAELQRLDELRSDFLLTVSHDLRTPLAAIAGLADVLADQPDLSASDRGRVVRRIRESARSVMGLFTDLMDLERFQRHQELQQLRLVDVGALVAAVAARVELGDRHLVVDVAPAPGRVDPVLVERMVENLLRNAAQHTPEGTRVWARCRREPDQVLVVVEDDGPGVPDDLADTAFELFRRGRTPVAVDGLGVGLALVERFAELHGGHARLERRQGGGASFHVLLPQGASLDGDRTEGT